MEKKKHWLVAGAGLLVIATVIFMIWGKKNDSQVSSESSDEMQDKKQIDVPKGAADGETTD